MDGGRFDSLTKDLLSSCRRPTLLQGALGGALLVLLPGRGFAVEAARRGCTKKKKCSFRKPCGQSDTCECFFVAGTTRNECFQAAETCDQFPACEKTRDCPEGTACAASCCEVNMCVPLCGMTTMTEVVGPRSGSGASPSLP